MLSKEKLERINELAKKGKSVGLSLSEQKEQQTLRKEYLNTFRNSFKETLHSVKVVDKEGNDVTPKKLQDSKEGKNDLLQ